jgi:ankyrin repeat protein
MINIKLFNLIKKHKWKKVIHILNNIENQIQVDVDLKDNQNNYMLTYAVLYNKIDIAELLLKKGARIDILDNDKHSLLYIVIKYEYTKMLDLLLVYNKSNIGINILDIKDKNNNIAIHYAIKYNNLYALTKLLENNININVYDNLGYNPLHHAIYMRSYDMCELIIKHNININSRCKTGETGLHLACNLQLLDIAELLINNNINIDIQDYEYEFTALHYCISVNNKKLIQILLNKGANVNIQDIYGNTCLHYIVNEQDNNFETLDIIINTNTKNTELNYNLWNLDGQIPLVLLLFKSDNIQYSDDTSQNNDRIMRLLITNSNLNIQDNLGNTALHYLCKYGIWSKYIDILLVKKMDMFIANKENIRPFDYINKQNQNIFIDLIIDSYLYRLKNQNALWTDKWENDCFDDVNICKKKIKKKILELVNKTNKYCTKSFPLKKNYICLNISEGTKTNMTTFTGTTFDILIGLIYLLNKHKYASSTLSANFIENPKITQYYKNMGIIVNSRCEFLNFEMVWLDKTLYYNSNFISNFNKCLINPNKKYIIIPIGIEIKDNSHSNYLFYDKKTKEIERFEPHGHSHPSGFDYNSDILDKRLKEYFINIDENIKYIKPMDYLPKIGFQQLDIYENKNKKIGDPMGFCALWAIWYIDNRITYYDLDRKILVNNMIKQMKENNISFKNMIRNYAKNIIDIRDNILNSVNLDINDWLNEQFTNAQYASIKNTLIKDIEYLSV